MSVRVVPYSSELESEFIAAYNRSTEHVPDCYPVQSVHATAFRCGVGQLINHMRFRDGAVLNWALMTRFCDLQGNGTATSTEEYCIIGSKAS